MSTDTSRNSCELLSIFVILIQLYNRDEFESADRIVVNCSQSL